MARDETPPFDRGKTYFSGGTVDSTAPYGGLNFEGKEYKFEDKTYGGGSSQYVTVRCVRNTSGAALLPKRLVSFATGFFGTRVDGYTTTTAALAAGVVDEFLPAAGVPDKDLFFIVVRGPALVKTDIASGANNVISEGDPLNALTAATSGATTAGRIYTAVLTGATSVLANPILNMVGRAMSAKTTANTNSDLLVEMGKQF